MCQLYLFLTAADLRRTLVAQLKPYTRKARPTGVELGSGTYGSVMELVSAKETVAGKVFRISSTERLQMLATKVCGELILMAQLHHPHIVRCKGVSLLPDQSLPVLLMGAADEQSPCLPPGSWPLQSLSGEESLHPVRRGLRTVLPTQPDTSHHPSGLDGQECPT